MDIGTAIKEIERLAVAANKSEVVEIKQERPGVYLVIGPDGRATKTVADPAWHNEKLETPEELAKFVTAQAATDSATFLGETKLVFVRSLSDRRDVATCDLKKTIPFQWLEGQSGMMHSQSEMVRILRIVFRGCLASDSQLLPLIRNLKFNVTADGAGQINHARESLGRSVLASVTGDSAIPEEITLQVPVYENFSPPVRVVCAIEVFPQEQKFKLTPYPLELRRAVDGVLDGIASVLSQDGMPPVYRGSPS